MLKTHMMPARPQAYQIKKGEGIFIRRKRRSLISILAGKYHALAGVSASRKTPVLDSKRLCCSDLPAPPTWGCRRETAKFHPG